MGNEDLLPIEMKDRQWGVGNYATLWLGSVHNIPSYMTIGVFFTLGLSVYEVFGAIMAASIILATAIIINSKMGVKYGIPFSMALKASYGTKGAILPGFLRGCVAAIMWFGFQTFAGSEALTILIAKFWPGFLDIRMHQLISFSLFWACNVALIYGGMDAVGKFAKILSPVVYIVFGGMAIWAINLAGGVGAIMNYTPKGIEGNSFMVILGCISAILATWSAPIVSIADISRNAKSQKSQIIGNIIGIIVPYILFAIAGISIIVGSEIAFKAPIWNVIDVINKFDSTFAIGVSVLTLCMTTLSVNIVGNIIPAGYQLAALFPKKLNFRKGALIAAIISVLIMPWKLAENSTSIFAFLNTIGGLLGPVSGVMLADYFIVNKQEIDINSLYSDKGKYEYSKGYNKNAYIATILAGFISIIGQVVPSMKIIYDISWIAGVGLGFVIYIYFWQYQKTQGENFMTEQKNQNSKFISLVIAFFMVFTYLKPTISLAFETEDVEVSSLIENTAKWIIENVDNPGYEDEWKVIGLKRGNLDVDNSYYDTYYNNLVEVVKEKQGNLNTDDYTEYSRVILALTALGQDPTDVVAYDLVEKLYDFDNIEKQGLKGIILALIALDSKDFEIEGDKNSRDKMINYIIESQLSDGGFALLNDEGDIDITAMAIQALSKYRNQDDVNEAINKGIEFLSKSQLPSGGFETDEGETLESNAQVLVAINSLGMGVNSEEFIKDGNTISDAISRFEISEGGFKHLLSDEGVSSIATEQALCALVSQERLDNGKTSLYDMSDVSKEDTPVVEPEPDTKPETSPDTKPDIEQDTKPETKPEPETKPDSESDNEANSELDNDTESNNEGSEESLDDEVEYNDEIESDNNTQVLESNTSSNNDNKENSESKLYSEINKQYPYMIPTILMSIMAMSGVLTMGKDN